MIKYSNRTYTTLIEHFWSQNTLIEQSVVLFEVLLDKMLINPDLGHTYGHTCSRCSKCHSPHKTSTTWAQFYTRHLQEHNAVYYNLTCDHNTLTWYKCSAVYWYGCNFHCCTIHTIINIPNTHSYVVFNF